MITALFIYAVLVTAVALHLARRSRYHATRAAVEQANADSYYDLWLSASRTLLAFWNATRRGAPIKSELRDAIRRSIQLAQAATPRRPSPAYWVEQPETLLGNMECE